MAALELWWLGQAGFRLRDPDGGPTLFVDPFLSPRSDRAWQAPVGPESLAAADLVLSTHEHVDHFDRPALRAAAAVNGSRFRLMLPLPLADDAVGLGVPPERVTAVQPGEAHAIGGASVHVVPARHGVHVADAYSMGEALSSGLVRYVGYVVALGGLRVYHAGDCIPFDGQVELLQALRPDVALLPINGRDYFRETERNIVGNMDDREAARLAHAIGARILVPMHWELFAHNRGYPSRLMATVEERYPELTVLAMGRGARVVLRADAPDT